MSQPIIYTTNQRPFATSAVALQAVIINDQEQFLLLNNQRRGGGWQTVSGGLDAGESLLAGTLREVGEEVGPAVQARPLGLVHAETFHYDAAVQFMISSYYLLAYEGGEVVPGDDMAGSSWRWWSLAELKREPDLPCHPSLKLWLLERAVQLYRLWQDGPQRPLQPDL